MSSCCVFDRDYRVEVIREGLDEPVMVIVLSQDAEVDQEFVESMSLDDLMVRITKTIGSQVVSPKTNLSVQVGDEIIVDGRRIGIFDRDDLHTSSDLVQIDDGEERVLHSPGTRRVLH